MTGLFPRVNNFRRENLKKCLYVWNKWCFCPKGLFTRRATPRAHLWTRLSLALTTTHAALSFSSSSDWATLKNSNHPEFI